MQTRHPVACAGLIAESGQILRDVCTSACKPSRLGIGLCALAYLLATSPASALPEGQSLWGTWAMGGIGKAVCNPSCVGREQTQPYDQSATITLSDGASGVLPTDIAFSNSYNYLVQPGTIKFTASASGAGGVSDGQIGWSDTLFISVPGASDDTLTQIGISLNIDGSASGTYQFADVADVGSHGINPDPALEALGPENITNIQLVSSTDGLYPNDNWVDPTTYADDVGQSGLSLWTGSYQENWDVTVEGQNAIIPLANFIQVYVLEDGTLSFYDTAGFSISLPSGVTATSASGIPLPLSPMGVPEPSSLTLLLAGGLALAAVMQCKAKATATMHIAGFSRC